MHFLILSQYYPPETGAPQNRLSGLARELRNSGQEVSVLTAMPNYPQMKIHSNYKGSFYKYEILDNIPVHRSWIFTGSNRNIVSRLLNYFSFVFTSWMISYRIKDKVDYVLCESPPLFLGISAAIIAKRKKARLIFNVSDLWPESAERLGLVTNKTLLSLAYRLEKWIYKKSFLVTGQTQGICNDISKRFQSVNVHWLPNGIDENRFNPQMQSDWRNKNGYEANDFIVMYAGIIGFAQGLDCLIQAATLLKNHSKIKFVIIGDGPEKEKLIRMKESSGALNVFFHKGIGSDEIPAVLRAIDVAVIPLRKLDLFKGAIPSKIFENLAMQKPILLGVEGEAKELFIDNGNCGIAFKPEDPEDLSRAILKMAGNKELLNRLGENGRNFVLNQFGRKKIAASFMNKLLSLK
jgi:glycosyltransferase involved in cell wall biosynthesis